MMTGSIFSYLPPYARENKNHLDDAGIEPGPPAWQATALSITPCLSGNRYPVEFTVCTGIDRFLDVDAGTLTAVILSC